MDAAGSRAGFVYQPALDGLRAAAVLAVFLYHADPRHAPGGFLGVDVFFVISGFLITSLLLREFAAGGRIDFRAFWIRRARRLLPALACVLGFVAVYAWLWAAPVERSVIRGDGLASEFYFANWHFIFAKLSYFAQSGTPSPLRHMWSLAIEEQWYLIWPVVFAVTCKFAHRNLHRVLIAGASLFAVASALEMARVYKPGGDPSRAYYGTDTRVQALLIGVVLAAVLDRAPRRRRSARHWTDPLGTAAAATLVAIFAMVSDHSDWLYRGGFMLVAILSAVLVAAAIRPGLVQLVLSLRTPRYLGRISYGIYLWHWPLIILLDARRTHLSGASLLALRFIVTIAVAAVSYALVEQPIRRQGFAAYTRRVPRVARAMLPAGVAAVIASALFVTTTVPATWNMLARHDTEHRDVMTALQPELPVSNTIPARARSLRKPRGLFIGDSSGLTLSLYAAQEGALSNATRWSERTKLGCALVGLSTTNDPPLPACANPIDEWPTAISAFDPDLVVLETGPWELEDHYLDGRKLGAMTAEYRNYLVAQYERAVAVLTIRHARLLLFDIPCYGATNGTEGEHQRQDPARRAMLNSVIQDVAARHPRDVTILPWSNVLCPGGTYHDVSQGVQIRDDGVHFTRKSAPIVWKAIERQIDDAAERARDARDRARLKGAPQ